MILYHPAKDTNHCIYRLLSILFFNNDSVSIEKIRLLDFYASFPHLLKTISPWPQDIKHLKKLISTIPEPYEQISNAKRVFFELAEVQGVAIATLFGKGLLDANLYSEGELLLNKEAIPSELLSLICKKQFIDENVQKVLIEGLLKTVWEGDKGLKYRSGLLEYKYD